MIRQAFFGSPAISRKRRPVALRTGLAAGVRFRKERLLLLLLRRRYVGMGTSVERMSGKKEVRLSGWTPPCWLLRATKGDGRGIAMPVVLWSCERRAARFSSL